MVDISTAGFEILLNFARGYGFWTVEGVPPLRRWWPTAEHYLQAQKFLDFEVQEKIRLDLDPGIAKHLGRTCGPLRADWDEIKRSCLRKALYEKFWAHSEARDLLKSIPREIVFGSTVDAYYGIGSDGCGQNILGKELQNLQEFFARYVQRRQILISIADIGEPFEPQSIFADLTGVCPTHVISLVSGILNISPADVLEVDILFDNGFERQAISDFQSVQEMDAFLQRLKLEDCKLEVRLREIAVVTLWNGSEDNHLGRTDVNVLSCTVEALIARLESLLPVLLHFRPKVSCSIDGAEQALDMELIRSQAREGADVLINAYYEIAQHSGFLKPPDVDPVFIPGVHSGLSAEELVDKIRGIVWGAALGDAVGLSTEFMEKSEAKVKYPERLLSPARRYDDKHRQRWIQGNWTDDTDQLILLLDAIVAGNGFLSTTAFASSLKRWRNSGFPELGDTSGLGVGQTVHSVLEHPAFATAPHVAADVIWRQTGCTLAANGAIMRCAAAGIACFWDEALVEYNAAASAAVTHADPRCVSSSVCIALLLAQLLVGHDTSTLQRRRELALSIALRATKYLKGGDADELLRHVDVMASLERLQLSSAGIGYTMKPLSAAMWAFLHCEDFKEAIGEISMEAGDADSNATVAGALLGARLGHSKLPADWMQEIPSAQTSWLEEKLCKCLHMLGLATGCS